MKKGIQLIMMLFAILLIMPLVLAQSYKLSIETKQEIYEPGQKISLKVSLLDSNNNQFNDIDVLLVYDKRVSKDIKKIYFNGKKILWIFLNNA